MCAWQSSGGRSDGDTGELLQPSVAECEYGVEVGVRRPQSGGDDPVLVKSGLSDVGPSSNVMTAHVHESFACRPGQHVDQIFGLIRPLPSSESAAAHDTRDAETAVE